MRTLSSSPGRIRSTAGRRTGAAGPDSTEGVAPEGSPDRAAQDGGALEVALGAHPEPVDHRFGHRRVVDGADDLVGRPDVEPPLDALGVGVLGRVHASGRRGQVPAHVADDAVHHVEVVGPTGDLPAVEEGPHQAGLVVEHLLEVGDQPLGVGRVAGEPAAEMVVDAAGGHGVEGGDGHLLGPSAAAAGVDARSDW